MSSGTILLLSIGITAGVVVLLYLMEEFNIRIRRVGKYLIWTSLERNRPNSTSQIGIDTPDYSPPNLARLFELQREINGLTTAFKNDPARRYDDDDKSVVDLLDGADEVLDLVTVDETAAIVEELRKKLVSAKDKREPADRSRALADSAETMRRLIAVYSDTTFHKYATRVSELIDSSVNRAIWQSKILRYLTFFLIAVIGITVTFGINGVLRIQDIEIDAETTANKKLEEELDVIEDARISAESELNRTARQIIDVDLPKERNDQIKAIRDEGSALGDSIGHQLDQQEDKLSDLENRLNDQPDEQSIASQIRELRTDLDQLIDEVEGPTANNAIGFLTEKEILILITAAVVATGMFMLLLIAVWLIWHRIPTAKG